MSHRDGLFGIPASFLLRPIHEDNENIMSCIACTLQIGTWCRQVMKLILSLFAYSIIQVYSNNPFCFWLAKQSSRIGRSHFT
jgi:hypothetical protein